MNLSLLTTRFFKALPYGALFTGTTHFRMPKAVRMCGKKLRIVASGEPTTRLDFINLVLDDEYGLKRIAPPPRTVLDVGANVGMFSLLAAHCFPDAVIHAYEPNPETYPYTKQNLDQIGATLFTAGLGSRGGRAAMLNASDSRQAQTQFDESGSIRIDPLSEAVARLGGHVDLMKIDCEGAEWDLFSDPETFQRVKLIRMEYHLIDGRTLDDLRSAIKGIGFEIDRLEPNQGFGIAWLTNPRFPPR